MDDIVIPYCVPEQEEHSFFFIDQRIKIELEAKLHRHEAWELYYVVHGYGNRMAIPFSPLLPAMLPYCLRPCLIAGFTSLGQRMRTVVSAT